MDNVKLDILHIERNVIFVIFCAGFPVHTSWNHKPLAKPSCTGDIIDLVLPTTLETLSLLSFLFVSLDIAVWSRKLITLVQNISIGNTECVAVAKTCTKWFKSFCSHHFLSVKHLSKHPAFLRLFILRRILNDETKKEKIHQLPYSIFYVLL